MSVATMIIKGVLGGIGGGFESVGKNHAAVAKNVGTKNTNNSKAFYQSAYDTGNIGLDDVAAQRDGLMSQFGGQAMSQASSEMGKEASNEAGKEAGKEASKEAAKEASKQAGKEAAKNAAAAMSDACLKSIYGDSLDDKIIENFAKIAAIDFHYKPEAQAEYAGKYGVDSAEHIGVKAQDLEKNEATKGTVFKNENGDKTVDTRHLAFADTAAIAELSRRVLALEEVVKELQNR